MDLQRILLIALSTIAAGGLAFAFLEPLLSGEVRADARQKKLAATKVRSEGQPKSGGRTKQVADTIKEVERRKQSQNKIILYDKLVQAGLEWSKQKFFLVSAAIGLVVGLIGFVLGGPLVALGATAVGGFALPQWMLIFLRNRRIKKFTDELPNSLDIIVRGLKSGLPLGDCIRIIASEAQEPVRGEFRQIVESQSLGLSIPEAVNGITKRMPSPEANFFSIVIEIQSKSGGNLSEVLSNLSRVLRERKKMRGKVQAMSMEAKASAAIIAALPFIVAILVYMSSPEYMSRLWTTEAGKLTMVISGFWMLVGIMSMKKMINFDI